MTFLKRGCEYDVLDSRDNPCGVLKKSRAGRWFFDSTSCSLHTEEIQEIADKLRELNGGATDGQENQGH